MYAPRRTDWPVYDTSTGEYVDCNGDADERESMLELSDAEATSLQLAEVFVDYRREKGKLSKGPTHNFKKLSVVRVEWIPEPVRERCLTVRAQAALRFYERHPVSAQYLQLYKEWCNNGSLDRTWKPHIRD